MDLAVGSLESSLSGSSTLINLLFDSSIDFLLPDRCMKEEGIKGIRYIIEEYLMKTGFFDNRNGNRNK